MSISRSHPRHRPRLRLAGLLAAILVAAGVGFTLATLVTVNGLFVSSAWQTPAFVTLVVLALSLFVFAALGRPWEYGTSTSYW